MPTIKPRVQVTLEPETHVVIDRLAALQGRSRGAVIADMLDSIVPALNRTVALLEAAKEAPQQIKDGLRRVVEDVHQDLVAVAGQSTGQLDMLLSGFKKEGFSVGSEVGSTPVLVTRGSGRGVPHSKALPKKPSSRSKPGL